MDKKKKKKANLHVVEQSVEALKEQVDNEEFWSLSELTTKLKRARKKIKRLEGRLETVTSLNDTLKDEHATLVKKIDVLDTRTQRMGIALRECMKKLGVARPN